MTRETSLRREVVQFQTPILRKCLCQFTTSFGGFFAARRCMPSSTYPTGWRLRLRRWLPDSCWATSSSNMIAGIFCSFERPANDVISFACSQVRLTPYASWPRINSTTDLAAQEDAVIGSEGASIARNKFKRTTSHEAIIWLACER